MARNPPKQRPKMKNPNKINAENALDMVGVEGSTPSAPTISEPLYLAHFWGRVTVGEDRECWPWRGRRNGYNYGIFRKSMAHRVAHELVNGPIPEGLVVRHRCDNPRCCNPRHLLVGTHQDNSNDAIKRGRTTAGMKNPSAKLTDDQIVWIRTNDLGMSQKAIAVMFGVREATISNIVLGRTWRRKLKQTRERKQNTAHRLAQNPPTEFS